MLEIGWMAAMGVVAGMHCILMCGPLALALPLGQKSKTEQTVLRLIFIAGRVLVYGVMGGLVGLLGKPISWLGFQQILLAIGLLILIGWVALWQFDFFLSARTFLQRLSRQLLQSQPKMAFFSLGLANGLLPCGAVYAALAFAAVSGSVLGGSALMLTFGLATSWWHLLLMLGWRIPRLSFFPWLRFLASPRASLAVVSVFLIFRMIQTANLQPEAQPGQNLAAPKALHFCGK